MTATDPPRRIELAVFLAVVAFTYGSITRGLEDGNTWSRMGLVFSVVERHVLNIRPYVYKHLTNDWSWYEREIYSNKAPGPALLAVPAYFVQHAVQGSMGVPDDSSRARDVATYVANAIASIVPTLLALALLFRVLERRSGLPSWACFALCATWAFASLAFPYSVLFFGHQTAAAFFTIGMCLSILELDREGGPRRMHVAGAGLAMGMAAISDYQVIALIALWTAYLLFRDRRSMIPWIAGGVGPAVVAMAYHYACFGSPFTTPYDLSVLNPTFTQLATWEAPQLSRLLDVTIRPYRGLFYCTPVFLLIFVGLDRLRVEAKRMPELLPAAAGVAIYFVLLISFPSWYGGWCVGPRYFTPALPFAVLLIVPAARLLPALFGAVAAGTALLMLITCITNPLFDERLEDPFRQYLFPTFLGAVPHEMHNVFSSALGWSLIGAFWGYVIVWAAAGGWIFHRLRGRGGPKRGALEPSPRKAVHEGT